MQKIREMEIQALLKDEKRYFVFYKNYLVEVTGFLLKHPGGSHLLIDNRNKDITELVEAVHEHVNIFKYIDPKYVWEIK